jgi:ankyrin repeat protein
MCAGAYSSVAFQFQFQFLRGTMTDDSSSVPRIDALLADGRPLDAHAAMACLNGDLTRLRELLEPLSKEEVDELLFRNCWENNLTLLLMACTKGHVEVVKYLVEGKGADPGDSGADPDKSFEDYQTGTFACLSPLHMAAAAPGHGGSVAVSIQLARCLVDNGASPWQVDRNLSTAFHHACRTGNLDLVRYFVEESGMSSDPFNVPMCLDHSDIFGGTGLTWAVRECHADIVRYLLSKGADKQKRDKKGKAPMDYAGDDSIVSLLLQE